MPYKSEAQRRFFNSEKGKEVVGKKNVEKFNKESKGLKLPEKVKEKDETLGEYIKSSFDECKDKDEMLKRRIATMGKANDTNMKILKALDSIEKVLLKMNDRKRLSSNAEMYIVGIHDEFNLGHIKRAENLYRQAMQDPEISDNEFKEIEKEYFDLKKIFKEIKRFKK